MKKVVWIDNFGDRWENLEVWRELHACPGQMCPHCPLSKENNGRGVSCHELVRDDPERVLELMQGELCRMEVEEKNLFRNVRTGEQKQIDREDCPPMGVLCNGFVCIGDCPIWKKVEESNYEYNSCRDWMLDHWEEGLKLLEWEKVEGEKVEDVDMKQETIKQKESEHDYFLMRHLGVGYRERFHVEGTDGVYYVGVAGRLFRVYDGEMGRKREIEGGQVLYNLLEHPEKVRKIGLTEEHKEYLEAVMKVLPEVQWVKRDGGWLLLGKESVVLLTRVGEDWEELGEGKEREIKELLGK